MLAKEALRISGFANFEKKNYFHGYIESGTDTAHWLNTRQLVEHYNRRRTRTKTV